MSAVILKHTLRTLTSTCTHTAHTYTCTHAHTHTLGCTQDLRAAAASAVCELLSSSGPHKEGPWLELRGVEDACAGVRLMLEQALQVCVFVTALLQSNEVCVCVCACVCVC